MKIRFRIEGLNCASCAAKIERAVQDMDGVESVSLNMSAGTMSVMTDMEPKDVRRIVQDIADRIEPGTRFLLDGEPSGEESDRWNLLRTVGCATVFLITFILELFGIIGHETSAIVFIAVFVLAGADTIVSALRGILHGDVFGEAFLMTVATVGAVLIGQYTEAAAVMVFFSVGELLEDYAVGSSRRRISGLLDMAPKVAHVETLMGVKDVDPESVSVGDVISVRPGELIPLDGIVVRGSTELDTSALTGESIPVTVDTGYKALSGSLNISGTISVRVTDTFHDSTMTRIMEMMQDAGDKKAKSERFITRFARYYTPIVCLLALLVAVIPILLGMDAKDWIYRALTFLVLSCPCALVISIPMTIMSGIGCASSHGILIKGGNYLEMLSHVDTMAFDKTGTLTEGRFSVVDVVSDERYLIEKVSSALECNSNHPLAKAVCREFGGSDLAAEDIREIPGKGMSGVIGSTMAYAGNSRLMSDLGFDVDDPEGRSSIHVVYDGRYLGHIDLEDTPKDNAKTTLSELKRLGVRRTVMLTGDKDSIAKDVSSRLNMDEYRASMLPQDKMASVEELIDGSDGCTVFVGDGINDSPTLRRADIGISMGQIGSDTALEASDIIIAGDDLSKIPLAMRISRRTMSIVKQNIALSLGMKVAVLALTLFGMSEMWYAVIADVGACILAIVNSLRALNL